MPLEVTEPHGIDTIQLSLLIVMETIIDSEKTFDHICLLMRGFCLTRRPFFRSDAKKES